MKKRHIYIAILILLFFGIKDLYASAIYVKNGDKIQNAIDAANDKDVIIVKPGTYFECINFKGKNITLASQFFTTGDSSYISKTIIDADNKGRVVTFAQNETSAARLIGFTIQNGHSNTGAGILCDGTSPIITNCVIRSNFNEVVHSRPHSGAITCRNNSKSMLYELTIDDNHGGDAGAICSVNSKPLLMKVEITNNSSDWWSGGIVCFNSKPIIINSLIANNKGPAYGGAIYGSPVLINCTISNNKSLLFCSQGPKSLIFGRPHLINTIISDNSCDYAIYSSPEFRLKYIVVDYDTVRTDTIWIEGINADDTVKIQNSVFWNNGLADFYDGRETKDIALNWNDSILVSENNTGAFPYYKDALNNDFRLHINSPCINVGTPDTTGLFLPEYDLNNEERIRDNIVDIGAYEYQAGISVVDKKRIVDKTNILYNGFNKTIVIETTLNRFKPLIFQLVSIDGKIIMSKYIETTQNYCQIPANNLLSATIYFATITTQSGKIIKSKKIFYYN